MACPEKAAQLAGCLAHPVLECADKSALSKRRHVAAVQTRHLHFFTDKPRCSC
jgi:hypothetical protein